MTASFINRAFGRFSLHGVARVRHASLTAAKGYKQHAADQSSSTGMRGGENAWDSIGDRAQGGSSPKRESWGGAIPGRQLN